MILPFDVSEKPKSYKSYKNEQFNKKIEKARNLINSIDDTSLRSEDKVLLRQKIKEML